MSFQSVLLILLLLVAVVVLISIGLYVRSGGFGTGILEIHAAVSPLCPVEPCAVIQIYPYAWLNLTATSYFQQTTEIQIPLIVQHSSAVGVSLTELPSGTYTIDSNCTWLGCMSAFPTTVDIRTGRKTVLTLNIDTGIR